ncbi:MULTISPECIES: FecR family protein [Niastella]|uniref:FecR domain-containing protein n=1 Tax=Niastella soli TaxID=2821487 RepID=A0ABS3Z6U1_9BACT|nr:FecR domain-containing protein [Niastella soli]MBO9205181.1 FecR domain-containing protein [Niastella soli]
MKQSPLPVEELIQRFRNNECTPQEIELLQQWMAQLDLSDELTILSPEQLDAVKSRMHLQLMSERTIVPERHRLPYRRRLLVAASWLVLAVSTILIWYFNRPSFPGNADNKPLFTVIENNHAGIRRVTLPDGSQVWLNMYSRLEFDPKQFNRTRRLVKLSGEGFFEVVPSLEPGTANKKIPFVVETGSLHTRVLGTAFNIEAYEQESEVRVSLVHGKVALDDTATDQTTELSPNHMVRYSKQTQSWEVLPVEAANVALWTQGYLVFNEVPLKEALERVENSYQVHIEYEPALVQHKRITASFRNSTWSTVLTNILFVHDLQFKKAGEKIVVVRK